MRAYRLKVEHRVFIGIALAFGVQNTFAGDAWLVITSEPPGATIAVDNTYRGVTPQHPGDTLRIQVSEGTRKIDAYVRIDGQDYAAQKTVRAHGARETAKAPVTRCIRASVRHSGHSPGLYRQTVVG